MRKAVYNCLLSNVPVESIGPIIAFTVQTLANTRLKITPSSSTCAQMMRELGTLSDLQSAEAILTSTSCCLAWDVTTLEGSHINEIHINTPDAVFTLSSRQLPGAKACDYVDHILVTLEDISNLYAKLKNIDAVSTFCSVKARMLSTLTDRAAANHATVTLLEQQLGRSLLELNCQLHPLDGLANAARSALKTLDQERQQRSKSFGSDCQAANVLRLISKLRYKAKGDPSGFKTHLRVNGLPCGTFARYVRNRLHVLFHLAGTTFHHRDLLLQYVDGTCSSQQLAHVLKADLRETLICNQLQALGLLGKIVTGPWMALFYTSVTERNHFELILDIFQVQAAASKATQLYRNKSMTTKNVHSEILYCLSPSKNITESFKSFGVCNTDKSLFAVLVDDDDDERFNKVCEIIGQDPVPVEEAGELANESSITEAYKLTNEELSVFPLLDAVVSRIAAKEIITAGKGNK